MISNRNNVVTAYFHSTNPFDSMQYQQFPIRRSKVLTIKTSNVSFIELSTNNIHQQKLKQDLDRRSPIFIRRHRPTIENLSHQHQSSDVNDVFGNQLQLTSRNKLPRTSSLHSKIIKKCSQSLQTPIWSPTLTEKEIIIPTRSLRSKSHSLKYYQSSNEKKNSTPNLFISSKSINNDTEIFKKINVKDLVDEWEDPKSNVAVSSDEEDSIVTNYNHPIVTFNPQKFEHFPSSIFIPSLTDNFQSKTTNLQRRPYIFSLPTVVEDINDEI